MIVYLLFYTITFPNPKIIYIQNILYNNNYSLDLYNQKKYLFLKFK